MYYALSSWLFWIPTTIVVVALVFARVANAQDCTPKIADPPLPSIKSNKAICNHAWIDVNNLYGTKVAEWCINCSETAYSTWVYKGE